jgi:hypothetical protein
MTNIKFGFSKKDSHDFKIITKRVTICNEYTGKKITEKYKIARFRNEEIDFSEPIRRYTKDVPNCLKNVEYFMAPNPFGKYYNHEVFSPYGWTFSTAILAFKHGYIDGFFMQQNTKLLLDAQMANEINAIIIIDPIQRIKVRKWIENEYKDFLENCNEEDFEYSICDDCGIRIGINKKYDSVDDIKRRFIEYEIRTDKDSFFLKQFEINAVKKYGFDKVFDALCNILFYTSDILDYSGRRLADPLTFKTIKDAKDFESRFNEWRETYRGNREIAYIVPVNEKFDSYLKTLI